MRKLIYLVLALTGFTLHGQCDVSIIDYDYNTGNITVDVIDSENCGCNEFTINDTECEDSGSPNVQNNETVSNFVLGLHIPGLDEGWTECVDNTYHDGWTWKVKNFYTNTALTTGDTWDENIYEFSTFSNDCWDEILDYAQANELCAELVMWQINLSQTVMVDDGGWAVNPNTGNQTQAYPDVDITNNSFLICPLVYPGCTDPVALNYDPEATIDNGTCIYSIGPDLMGIELNIIQQWCNGFDHENYSFEFTVTNIGTENVEYFCINDFLGTGFSCYDGLLNDSVLVPPGDTITVGGSFQIIGGWSDNQMNFMTITSIPGEIITGNNNFTFSMGEELDCSTPPPNECDTIYIETIDTLYVDNFITDSVYINLIDTLYLTETVYEIDTLYITQTFTDTVYLTETIYLTDTLYFTEYIIDTVTQYIVEEVLIDCETGLPCNEDPGYPCFGEGSIYVPNTFTPNNDGINDVWKLVYELDCYMDIEFWIFNRWGNEIFHAYGEDYESYPYWDGSVNGGSHYAVDGIYIYKLKGRKAESPTIIEETGHITIFR